MRKILVLAALATSFLPAQDSKYRRRASSSRSAAKADTEEWLRDVRMYRDERRVRAG